MCLFNPKISVKEADSEWNFPTLGVPPNHHVNKIIHYKPSILGYCPFMNTPIFLLDLLLKTLTMVDQRVLNGLPALQVFFSERV